MSTLGPPDVTLVGKLYSMCEPTVSSLVDLKLEITSEILSYSIKSSSLPLDARKEYSTKLGSSSSRIAVYSFSMKNSDYVYITTY